MKKLPIIGITMGDPASIGPEISLKTLNNIDIYKRCRPIIIGDTSIMEKAKEYTGLKNLKINSVKSIDDALFIPGTIDVYNMEVINPSEFKVGEIAKVTGGASFQYIKKVIELANEGTVDATVTNAISKEAINLAGHHFSGHTEIYANFTNTKKYTMMLAHENLRVVHVSTHVSLREACDNCKRDRVYDVIKIANDACKKLGILNPKIGVAGLNPHCGENGLFGTEEIEEIIPAIEKAKNEGVNVAGPIPPDTVFSKARGGWYDIVVAMYHDQGHIPLKVIGFVYNQAKNGWEAVSGVNITLGLPIIRSSVDHGTAFDQAGSGKASELSLINAIDYAITLANNNL
ncbi:4-hydroxythreonine-4-phosphate dehydrogenase PdxA [Cetobacterium sp. 8H]|uniref:4-hydroxythreonine-4-phosphate dehydrogenase PdxA n=1 Tax=Cetobacterium sp. 8H TaxID=2759681 RepID=UPI00163BBDC8|nr:4-hydroxythreonine-4-phosphate dehydrogenase PdxA [Cetobacterium sp. 8H]MBC2849973.1 4-hydroxythreonine-4-phosphate dehydrogenase PdxA [Cetobacterium sp. 8H]